jgi:hypothetical protein
MREFAFSTILLILAATPVVAQTADSTCVHPVDLSSYSATDARAALRRAVDITSPRRTSSQLFRAFSDRTDQCADSLAFVTAWSASATSRPWGILPVSVQSYANSAYPRSVNDMGSWRGTGLNLETAVGVTARWRFLSGAVAPQFYYNANTDHPRAISTLPGLSPYANPYHGAAAIDFPKRFGSDPLTTITPGQSYLRAEYGSVAATFSTENLWIGAAEMYPIIMSNTAPGFPHLRIGTWRSFNVAGVVNAEFQIVMGSVQESEFFDTIPDNDEHFFATAMVTLEPRFLPGLYLSVGRVNHDTASAFGHGPGFYLGRIIESPFGGASGTGNRAEGNAIGFVFGRWVLPESGFEAYAEWSKEDTPGGFEDLLREPDWTQAYVLGFQKVFKSTERMTRIYGELIHLGESAPSRAGRGFFSYYTHTAVRQGHTNRGQLLGAAIGPGSDAQLIGVDFFSPKGRSGARVERTRYDDDTYYRVFARRFGETRHDAEISLSVSRLQFFEPFEVEGELMISRRYDRDFITLLDDEQEPGVETNWGLRFTASWRPGF